MNIKIKKNFIIFAIIFLLQICILSNTRASEKIDDEELPALDPFAGGAGLTTTQDPSMPSIGASVINDMKLVGTISGSHKKLAVLAMPDGRALKFEENEFVNDDIQILEIYEDFVVIRVGSKDQYEVYMNNQIRPMEGN
tara:strand:- start:408 stop:824 length:417 start_codon:yes stop_codon:yes gene_type:complete